MAALDDLLDRITDSALRAELERELLVLRTERELGLVFERHLPEKVRLPGLKIHVGATVEIADAEDACTWMVAKLDQGQATLVRRDTTGKKIAEVHPAKSLVVVREFGHPIYPGLRSVGRVEKGGDRPFHSVIKAENFHALETLLYTHAGKVDCIYIDPPYNSGAKDWKYNNHYVDGNDIYRHSKWLSFMEKRLQIAKTLLRPDQSGLILTIDEKEVHRVGLLLSQVFPSAKVQMISSVINPKGVVRDNEFSRSDEYLFFVTIGDARLAPEGTSGNEGAPVPWQQLRRTDIESARGTKKGGKAQFFPIYVNKTSNVIEHIGKALDPGTPRAKAPKRPGCVAVFPVRDDGQEMNWGLTAPSLQKLLDRGFVRASNFDPQRPQQFTLQYLTSGRIKDIDGGAAEIAGYEPSGAAVVKYKDDVAQRKMATTAWNRPSHNAQYYGTALVKDLLGGRAFPFPKSLYAVEDAIRFYVRDIPDAVVLDFFGGSGTTAHAVMRLNNQDGGRRSSIVITNNEVSDEEAQKLRDMGLKQGDRDWESLGIFEYITRPRIEACVTGVTPDGTPISGEYKFVDEFPICNGLNENVEFFELTYEDADHVRLGAAFSAIAPLLWLMAGAIGPRIDKPSATWSIPKGGSYGILFDPDHWSSFTKAAAGAREITHAFIVTDSDAVFQRVVADLPESVQSVRLYESYLRSFAINKGTHS